MTRWCHHVTTPTPFQQDPEGFIEDGGWSFLDAEQSDSEGEGEEEESDFAPRYISGIAASELCYAGSLWGLARG